MIILKKILGLMLKMTGRIISFIKGDGFDDLKKRLPAALGVLLAVICACKSIKALHKARKAPKAVKAVKKARKVQKAVKAVKKVKKARKGKKAKGRKAASANAKRKGRAKKGAVSLIKKILIKKLSS